MNHLLEMKTLIIMPVHNALPYVQRSTRWIVDNDLGPKRSLVVVDDASELETMTYLQGLSYNNPYVRNIRNGRQQLFTRTVNRGFRFANDFWRGLPEYVAVVNSDCELLPGWLEAMENILDTQPAVGLVGYRDSPAGVECALDPLKATVEDVLEPGYVTGHCWLIRSEFLIKHGVLCETDLDGRTYPEFAGLKGLAHIGSDRLLSHQVRQAGWKCVYCNYAGVHHEAGKSWGHNLNWLAMFDLQPLWEASDVL